MPGEVAEDHAEFEKECGKCHPRLRKAEQRDLCLKCHEPINEDLISGKGYHGRNTEVTRKECSACHDEHMGRGAAIITLNERLFPHELTDFPLEGSHQAAPCRGCHEVGAKHRDAPPQCVACHEGESPHWGRLENTCSQCHTPRDWREVEFDHATTAFVLEGHHLEATCASCHPNERYQRTPSRCVACHGLQDSHRRKFGQECHDCHTPADWKKSVFDHDEVPDFPLLGRHETVPCQECHQGTLYKENLRTACVACHESDDEHRGRRGERCEACHEPRGWKHSRFDHDRDSDFPLQGKHRKVRCDACHAGNVYEKLDTACHACHEDDDPHAGQEGPSCERCHDPGSWRSKLAFDHDLTRLPLLGLHAVAPCEACHLDARFKDADLECAACHARDDTHEGRLGDRCAVCHNPNGWALWSFDHSTQTGFVLDGAHEGLDCHACHRQRTKRPRPSKTCRSCHATDDVHRGAFGPRCGQCHGTKSFADAVVRR